MYSNFLPPLDDFSSPELVSLKNALKQRGVKYVLASFVDIHGFSKVKAVPINHFEQMMRGSELFVGAAIDGFPHDLQDEELAAVPDPNSSAVLPWNKEIAWFASDLMFRGEPFEGCSRGVLKRVLGQANSMGYRLNLGIEAEFYMLQQDLDGNWEPVSDRDTLPRPYYDLPSLLDNYAWLNDLVEAMNDLNWDVYSFDHEDGNGQFEIDFNYTDGLKMGDRFTFFRMMAREYAQKHGYLASFMPKPFGDRAGSGAHFNVSLGTPGGENLFFSNDDPRGMGLSQLGYQFIAGVLKHAPALCAVMAPTVNSYKRLVPGGTASRSTWAPIYASYGNNRTSLVRIPLGGSRIECRLADSACNPYLAAAMLLAAGMEGIRDGLDPGEPHTENMLAYAPMELQQKGVASLPRTLGEAIEAFITDPLSYEVMGAGLYDAYISIKFQEWEAYCNQVSEWEKTRYLQLF